MFQLGNGSWMAFSHNMTIIEKHQILSYLEQTKNEIPSFKEMVDGFFTEKQLEERRLAQLYRHCRTAITGREDFLGQVESIYTNFS